MHATRVTVAVTVIVARRVDDSGIWGWNKKNGCNFLHMVSLPSKMLEHKLKPFCTLCDSFTSITLVSREEKRAVCSLLVRTIQHTVCVSNTKHNTCCRTSKQSVSASVITALLYYCSSLKTAHRLQNTRHVALVIHIQLQCNYTSWVLALSLVGTV